MLATFSVTLGRKKPLITSKRSPLHSTLDLRLSMNPRKLSPVLLAVLFPFVAVPLQAAADAKQKAETGKVKGPRPEADRSNVAPSRSADKVLVFKKTPQTDLKAHIYFPPGWSASDQRPAIVFWSGGGFRNGAA